MKYTVGVPTVVQWFKDLLLLQLWHRLQLQLGFNPWPQELSYAVSVSRKREREIPDSV